MNSEKPLTEWQKQLQASVNNQGKESTFSRDIKPTETKHQFYKHFPQWGVKKDEPKCN